MYYCNQILNASRTIPKILPLLVFTLHLYLIIRRTLRNIFCEMRKHLTKKWPDHPTVKYSGPSGFIFLRFICPAILGPTIFGLSNGRPIFALLSDAIRSRLVHRSTWLDVNREECPKLGQLTRLRRKGALHVPHERVHWEALRRDERLAWRDLYAPDFSHRWGSFFSSSDLFTRRFRKPTWTLTSVKKWRK